MCRVCYSDTVTVARVGSRTKSINVSCLENEASMLCMLCTVVDSIALVRWCRAWSGPVCSSLPRLEHNSDENG